MTDRIRVVANRGEPAHSVCRCGARGLAIDVMQLGDSEPRYIAGPLTERCHCPRCFSCHQLLDDSNRCENLDCLNLGIEIVV